MFNLLLSKFGAWIAAIGAAVLAILAALGFAKRAGEKEEQAKQTEIALEQAKEANDIAQANRNLSDADALAKLRRDQRD